MFGFSGPRRSELPVSFPQKTAFIPAGTNVFRAAAPPVTTFTGGVRGRELSVESSLPRTPYPQKLRPVGRRRKGSWWCTVGVENRPMSAPFPFQPCVCRRKTGFPYARFLRVHPSGGKQSKRRPTVVARRRAHARMSIRGKRLSGKPPSFGGHSSPTVYKRLRHA